MLILSAILADLDTHIKKHEELGKTIEFVMSVMNLNIHN
jgi:hypothetical protein